jgi:hypothetical protein
VPVIAEIASHIVMNARRIGGQRGGGLAHPRKDLELDDDGLARIAGLFFNTEVVLKKRLQTKSYCVIEHSSRTA